MSVKIRGMTPLIQVFDMAKSLEFYCDKLGFTIVQSAGPENDLGWVFLKLEEVELMLNTAYELPDRPPKPDAGRQRHHGDTAFYFGCEDVDNLYAFLKTKGLEVKEPYVTGYGWKAIDLLDPDGYHLCFHWPVEQ